MIKRIYFLISIIQADRLNHKSKKDRFFDKMEFFARVQSVFGIWIWDQVNWPIENRSSFRCQRLRLPCLLRSVFKDNSRFVLIVILLSFSSLYLPARDATRVCISARNYRQIYKERRIYKPTKSGLSCSSRRVLKSSESTEKTEPRRRNARKKRP